MTKSELNEAYLAYRGPLEIKLYEPAHLAQIEGRAYEKQMAALAEFDFAQVFACGPAYTVFADGVPVMAGGIVLHWRGRGEAWLHLSPWFERHAKTGYRIIRKLFTAIMAEHPDLVRIEAPICAVMPKNLRLVRHLGFEHEGLMRHWGPDGRDYVQTAFVREKH